LWALQPAAQPAQKPDGPLIGMRRLLRQDLPEAPHFPLPAVGRVISFIYIAQLRIDKNQ
jgi:hypothetical protein